VVDNRLERMPVPRKGVGPHIASTIEPFSQVFGNGRSVSPDEYSSMRRSVGAGSVTSRGWDVAMWRHREMEGALGGPIDQSMTVEKVRQIAQLLTHNFANASTASF
jgi:hypothetical protein